MLETITCVEVKARTGCDSERGGSLSKVEHAGRCGEEIYHMCILTQLPPNSEAIQRRRDSLPSIFRFVTSLGSELSLTPAARPYVNCPPKSMEMSRLGREEGWWKSVSK